MTKSQIDSNIKLLNSQADKLRDQGVYFQAIELFKKLLPLYKKKKNNFGIGRSLLQIGLCHRLANQNKEALTAFKETIEFSKKIGDLDRQGYTFREIGTVYLNDDKFVQAKKWFEKSVKIFENSDDVSNYGMSLARLGLTQMHLENYAQAEKLMLKGLGLIKKNQHWFFEVTTDYFLGKFYFYQKKYQKSIQYLEDAENILNSQKQTDIQTRRYGQIWGLLAYDHLKLGNYNLAKEYYLDALECLFSMPDNVAAPIYKVIKTADFIDELIKNSKKKSTI